MGASPDQRFKDELNPFYTPRIMQAFRQWREKVYGGKLPDELFRLGNGKYADEPHYTSAALQFRDFKAGAEYVLSCLATDKSDATSALYKAGRASRDAEVEELRAALSHFVNQMESFRKMCGNQADAYYHFVKGQDAAWDRARAALASHPEKGAKDE